MLVELEIEGLEKLEADAKEILEHISAIRKIQMTSSLHNPSVSVRLKEKTASGN